MTINEEFNTISEEDLQTAEKFGIPPALIILIIVFGALVAAVVPIVLALVAIAVALGWPHSWATSRTFPSSSPT